MHARFLGAGALAIAAALLSPLAVSPVGLSPMGGAWAQEGGTDTAKGYQGGQGEGSKGARSGQGNQGGSGAGQGGPDPESDSKGPHAGGPAQTGSSGGKPAWAQEGIPAIDLGRLSVARAPQQVLDRALAEALATQSDSITDFYNLPFEAILDQFYSNWDNVTIYDSPLQNLALFQDILADGDSKLDGVKDGSSDEMKLLAVFLGVASDKTMAVTDETVEAMLVILGEDLPSTISVPVSTLADMAEEVRFAVYVGHEG